MSFTPRPCGARSRSSRTTRPAPVVGDRQRHREGAVAISTVLAEFLQQFFTFLFTAVVVVLLGGKLGVAAADLVPFVVLAARRIGQRAAPPRGAARTSWRISRMFFTRPLRGNAW